MGQNRREIIQKVVEWCCEGVTRRREARRRAKLTKPAPEADLGAGDGVAERRTSIALGHRSAAAGCRPG